MRERVLKSHFEKLSLATIRVRRYFYQIPGSNEVLVFFGKKTKELLSRKVSSSGLPCVWFVLSSCSFKRPCFPLISRCVLPGVSH